MSAERSEGRSHAPLRGRAARARRKAAGAAREVIGWYEYVEFPAWGIPGLKAKIDTGARTSALHVDGVRKLRSAKVRFDVVLHRKDARRRVSVEAPVLRRTRVKSSTGQPRTRWVVPALIRLGAVEKTIEVSLVSRDKMLFRMLLGRSAFSGEFLIDAARACALGHGSRSLAAPRPPKAGAKAARATRKASRPASKLARGTHVRGTAGRVRPPQPRPVETP